MKEKNIDRYIDGWKEKEWFKGNEVAISTTYTTIMEAVQKGNIPILTTINMLIKNQPSLRGFHPLELIEFLEDKFGKEFWKGDFPTKLAEYLDIDIRNYMREKGIE